MVYKLISEIENITFKNNKFLMQGKQKNLLSDIWNSTKKGMRITRIPFISLGQFNFLEL